MPEGNAIGDYLRARRELLRPKDVGIPEFPDRRRVPGLRRSELAMLAGISTEYYIRLEQGRDRHPSTLVIDTLARALKLDEHGTAHLHQLAASGSRRPRPRRIEKVPAHIDGLLRSLVRSMVAYVTDRLMNVLAANALAQAVLPLLAPGNNFVRAVFLDPLAREIYADIAGRQAAAAASLRGFAGADFEDPRFTELVAELSVKSPDFRRLWSRHDVKAMRGDLPPIRIRTPQLGVIDLCHQKLEMPDTGGGMLGLFYGEPGSKSEQALAKLAATIHEHDAVQSREYPARRAHLPVSRPKQRRAQRQPTVPRRSD